MQVLVTGGMGYIGSHTVVELLEANHDVVIVDNLSNSSIDVKDKIEQITSKSPIFYEIDLLDKEKLSEVFKEHNFDAIIHFAGLKAVGESVEKPIMYYQNNVVGSTNLIELAKEHQVYNFVFSSSATVYGLSDQLPLKEDLPTEALNPYGQSKIMVEEILEDVTKAHKDFSVVSLRYFNPIGAHESGLIGENPKGIPNNLVPYIAQVATKERDHLRVWGDDYDTIDGTGVRDYIHVVDLAKGHLDALEYAKKHQGIEYINLGTGNGYSVLQVVDAFEGASQQEVPYKIYDRRPGDADSSYADASKAKDLLGWKAKYDIHRMCTDTWRFMKNNQ